ncbi:MAG: hydroxyacid dehydrogenase [Spirochaetes bacterium]|nr:hydroxyacid dehydrogenase [Spirochaetota bacterium]
MVIAIIQPLLLNSQVQKKLFQPIKALGHSLIEKDCRKKEDDTIIEFAKDAEVIIMANMPISEKVINALPKLKMISVAFTGVDHIPLELCHKKNITICNAQGYATRAVCELVFGLLFSVYRKISNADQALRKGETSAAYFGTELWGKTFGIIGAGSIGEEVAKIALAFGCKVLAYSQPARPELEKLGIKMTNLTTLLKESDIVSLHVPLLESTKHMLNKEKLALMKPSTVIINTARGPLIDNEALTEALLNKQIAGAGLDVFDMEPPIPPDYCLLKVQDNIVVTPHIAYGTTESFIKRGQIVFDNVIHWLKGNPINVK